MPAGDADSIIGKTRRKTAPMPNLPAVAAPMLACLWVVAPSTGAAGPVAPASGTELPAQFDNDLVYVTPAFADGTSLTFYTDTGGGYFISGAAATRPGITRVPAPDGAPAGMQLARLPAQAGERTVPAGREFGGAIPVMPDAARGLPPGARAIDGMLGAPWFADRVWTWRFAARRFAVEAAGWTPAPGAHRAALGFRTDQDGARSHHFPRIDVRIDGQTLPMLLDTGAMTVLAPAALSALADGGGTQRATSMVADSVFQAWRRAHPEWRVIEGAQAGTGAAMIEVPSVEIAGWRTGPVWFTQRPDRNFHEFMSSMTDVRVDGAIGNNAFREFTLTVDYPGAAAYLECTGRCAAAQD